MGVQQRLRAKTCWEGRQGTATREERQLRGTRLSWGRAHGPPKRVPKSQDDNGSTACHELASIARRLSPEQAVALVLANEPDDAPGTRPALTRRETQVAALVARGLTNRDIAAQLFLSVRTVEVHVDHILTKLGFHTRTQLAAWAFEVSPGFEARGSGGSASPRRKPSR